VRKDTQFPTIPHNKFGKIFLEVFNSLLITSIPLLISFLFVQNGRFVTDESGKNICF